MSEVKRQSDKLAKLAKKVFGDELVVSAWVCGRAYGDDNPNNALDKVEKCITEEEDGFTYDYAESIEIQFCNNRIVRFTNSEWASIHLISE